MVLVLAIEVLQEVVGTSDSGDSSSNNHHFHVVIFEGGHAKDPLSTSNSKENLKSFRAEGAMEPQAEWWPVSGRSSWGPTC